MKQQKLYTKEMFLQAAIKCNLSMIETADIMHYIDEYLKPIELPSDEEIREKSIGYADYHSHQASFGYGAKWVIDKIQGGNK